MTGIRKKQSNGNFWLAVSLSLVLHVSIFLLRSQNGTRLEKTDPPENLIELAPLPPNSRAMLAPTMPRPPSKEAQVVETEDAGNREVDPNATLLSDRNQKATQETRAQNTDDFRKGSGTGSKGSEESETASIPPTGDESELAESEDELSLGTGEEAPRKAGIKRNWKTLSLKDLSVGGDGSPASASDDYLPGVAPGERTILSTREFRYFSYYNRIKDILRQYWKPSVEREVAKLWGKGRMLNENELTTRVLVLLDKEGKVQKISKVGNSGVSEIDEAAVQAFYQASPFPNPPTGLIDSDGFVRINWDFILQTASAPRIQFRPGRAMR